MKTATQILFAAVTLASASTAQAAIYRDNVENASVMTIAETTSSAPRKIVYSVGPIDVPANAVVDIRLQTEVTTNCSGNIGIGRYVVRASSATATSGTNVTPAALENVTADGHHLVIVHAGLEQPTGGLSGVYYNAVLYAVSSAGQGCYNENISNPPQDTDSDKVTIEGPNTTSFGELIVEVR